MKKKLLVFFFFPLIFLSQQLYFPPTTGSNWDTLSSQNLGWCQNKIDSLYNFLDTSNTKAFILLKDGKIVMEKYFGNHTANTLWYWASAGKSLTSFMVGIAQQEGYLSIHDTTSKYLGLGWTNCNQSQEEKITIKNQLSMTSGLDDMAGDPYCTLDTCLIYKADAGTRWAYHNGPYTLLDSVIKVATGISLNQYVTQKLKIPTGMTGTFYSAGFNNVFFSNARSMARFGLLALNKGNWNGNQIMSDTSYFHQMTHTSQQLNKAYGYLWWLNGSSDFMVPFSQLVFPGKMMPDAPNDLIAAIGKNGQFINVIPSTNMVWIRMGDAPDSSDVPFLLNNDIWKHINDLSCNNVGFGENHLPDKKLHVYPNPANEYIKINCEGCEIITAEILNLQGKSLKFQNESTISIKEIESGIYFLRVKTKDKIFTEKFIKSQT
jgi:CubicO group peptidase (beta-lactamase class C family)